VISAELADVVDTPEHASARTTRLGPKNSNVLIMTPLLLRIVAGLTQQWRTLLTSTGGRYQACPALNDWTKVHHCRMCLRIERKYPSPIALYIDDRPALRMRFVDRLIELADAGFPIVCVFTISVGVVHDAHEARAIARCGPLQAALT
jgi:hypothetical protein